MSQIRRNSRLNFSPRAAIWPLTLGPLGYSGARGTCPMCFLRKRPRGSTGHRRESARTPGERFRMPDNARSAAVDGPASIFRGSVPRAESESAARTYVRTFMSTHFPFKISYTPKFREPLAIVRSAKCDCSGRHCAYTWRRSKLRRTRRKHQSSNKKFLVRISSVKPNPTRLTNVTSR